VAGEVLRAPGVADAPLERHGPAATRRRWVRALVPALVLAVVPVVLVLTLDLTPWLLVATVALPVLAGVLAADRARTLGHAHVGHHLVARSGSIVRRRDSLGDEHVIGVNLRATWFQRRVGLSTLSATTAGGPQSVSVPDVPTDRAVTLALTVLPEVVGQFVDASPTGPLRR
jgi:putative membrane protein